MNIVCHRTAHRDIGDIQTLLKEINLTRYASEAGTEMEFSDLRELNEAVFCALQTCMVAGLDVDSNFKRVYLCSSTEIVCDWKLSDLAYNLVCINGLTDNVNVARLQVNAMRMIR